MLAVALAVVVGATSLTACASDPAPSDVAVAWAPKGRAAVLVTWKDTNQPNRITIEGVLSESPSYVKYIPAGDPNHWEIPTSAFPPDGNYKVAVATGTSQGGVTSKLAKSPVFDTDGPVRPSAAAVAPQGRGVLIRWSVPVAPQDFTPNDPLDVKGTKTQRYVPMVGRPGQLLKVIGPASVNNLWLQLKADVLGTPLSVSHLREVVSSGAQALASKTSLEWQSCRPREVLVDEGRATVLREWCQENGSRWDYLKGVPA